MDPEMWVVVLVIATPTKLGEQSLQNLDDPIPYEDLMNLLLAPASSKHRKDEQDLHLLRDQIAPGNPHAFFVSRHVRVHLIVIRCQIVEILIAMNLVMMVVVVMVVMAKRAHQFVHWIRPVNGPICGGMRTVALLLSLLLLFASEFPHLFSRFRGLLLCVPHDQVKALRQREALNLHFARNGSNGDVRHVLRRGHAAPVRLLHPARNAVVRAQVHHVHERNTCFPQPLLEESNNVRCAHGLPRTGQVSVLIQTIYGIHDRRPLPQIRGWAHAFLCVSQIVKFILLVSFKGRIVAGHAETGRPCRFPTNMVAVVMTMVVVVAMMMMMMMVVVVVAMAVLQRFSEVLGRFPQQVHEPADEFRLIRNERLITVHERSWSQCACARHQEVQGHWRLHGDDIFLLVQHVGKHTTKRCKLMRFHAHEQSIQLTHVPKVEALDRGAQKLFCQVQSGHEHLRAPHEIEHEREKGLVQGELLAKAGNANAHLAQDLKRADTQLHKHIRGHFIVVLWQSHKVILVKLASSKDAEQKVHHQRAAAVDHECPGLVRGKFLFDHVCGHFANHSVNLVEQGVALYEPLHATTWAGEIGQSGPAPV
mmetsp:Transcript_13564/g.43295  ORF Transcript_13564/g.43295 Transcript_13564/m.43295 type:complete len:591 (+) Transcript_13564:1248-3020(+)